MHWLKNIRNPASIQSRATIGPPVKRHWRVDSGTILRAYWEVDGQWAK